MTFKKERRLIMAINNKTNRYDSEGKRHGLWRIKNSYGRTSIQSNYINGKLCGLQTMWRSNTRLFYNSYFLNDMHNGMFKSYDVKGRVEDAYFYEKNIIEGEQIDYGYN